MRVIFAFFLILSFQSAFALDESYPIADYKCWLFTGVAAAGLQVIPQVIGVAYAQALSDEVRTAPHNATTPYILLFTTTSTISNAVGLLSSLPLIYNAGRGVVTSDVAKCQTCRRWTMEIAFAAKALTSSGMQAAATYLTFGLYRDFNGAPGTPDALLPSAITGMVSVAFSLLPLMGGVALVVKSACMARNGYLELNEQA